MIEFFHRLFGRPSSSSTAKERLRLVLLSDHLALAPEVVAALKADLLEVISRYVDIDRDLSDISFEQHDRSVAMLASVPVLGMKPQASRVARPLDEPLRGTPSPGSSGAPSQAQTHTTAVAVAEPPVAAPTEAVDAASPVLVEPGCDASASIPDDIAEASEAVPAEQPPELVEQLALGHPVPQAGRRKRKRRTSAAKSAGNAANPAAGTKPVATASPATG